MHRKLQSPNVLQTNQQNASEPHYNPVGNAQTQPSDTDREAEAEVEIREDNPRVQQTPKIPVSNWKQVMQQSTYPRGKRSEVMQAMTKVPPQHIKDFNNCTSWKEVYQFHRKHTPWLEGTQINEYIKMYKMEAQSAFHKGKLDKKRSWMLNDT